MERGPGVRAAGSGLGGGRGAWTGSGCRDQPASMAASAAGPHRAGTGRGGGPVPAAAPVGAPGSGGRCPPRAWRPPAARAGSSRSSHPPRGAPAPGAAWPTTAPAPAAACPAVRHGTDGPQARASRTAAPGGRLALRRATRRGRGTRRDGTCRAAATQLPRRAGGSRAGRAPYPAPRGTLTGRRSPSRCRPTALHRPPRPCRALPYARTLRRPRQIHRLLGVRISGPLIPP